MVFDIDSNKKQNDRENGVLQKRRTFLKKVAYTAPTLIVMGQLTRPNQAKAGFGPPPSAPGGW